MSDAETPTAHDIIGKLRGWVAMARACLPSPTLIALEDVDHLEKLVNQIEAKIKERDEWAAGVCEQDGKRIAELEANSKVLIRALKSIIIRCEEGLESIGWRSTITRIAKEAINPDE